MLIRKYLLQTGSQDPSIRDHAIAALRDLGKKGAGWQALLAQDAAYVAEVRSLRDSSNIKMALRGLLRIIQRSDVAACGGLSREMGFHAKEEACKAIVAMGPRVAPLLWEHFLATEDPVLKFHIVCLLGNVADIKLAPSILKSAEFPRLPPRWQSYTQYQYGTTFVTLESWENAIYTCVSAIRRRALFCRHHAVGVASKLHTSKLKCTFVKTPLKKALETIARSANIHVELFQGDEESNLVIDLYTTNEEPVSRILDLLLLTMSTADYTYTVCDDVLVVGPRCAIEAIDVVEVLLNMIEDSSDLEGQLCARRWLRELVQCPLQFDPTSGVRDFANGARLRDWWKQNRNRLVWNHGTKQFWERK